MLHFVSIGSLTDAQVWVYQIVGQALRWCVEIHFLDIGSGNCGLKHGLQGS